MNEKRLLIWLIGLHAVFMFKQIFFGNSLLQDSREYLYAADNLLKHQTLYAWNLNHAFNPDWLSKRPPLYPLILAGFRLLSFGSETLFLLLLYAAQNTLSILSLRMGLQLLQASGSKPEPWKIWLYVSLSCAQFIYANMVMCEIWLQACITALVWLFVLKPAHRYKWLYAALLMTAGTALKPVLIFAAILFPLFYLLLERKRFRVAVFALCLIPALWVAGISVWNQKRSGYFHYSSISGINLLHYNTYSLLMNRYGLRYADSTVDDIKTRARLLKDYAAGQKQIREECAALIRAHLTAYTLLHIRGMLFCLMDPGRFDITQFFGLPHGSNMLYDTNKPGLTGKLIVYFSGAVGLLLGLLIQFHVVRLFLLLRFIFSRRIALALRAGLLILPLYLVFLTGPIGASRFLMPLIPLLMAMCLAAAGKSLKGNSQASAH